MKSLLERMIQRTRAPLAGVEPLIEPRYSQVGGRSLLEPLAETSATFDAAFEAARGATEASPATHISAGAGSHDPDVPELSASRDRVLGLDTHSTRPDPGRSLAVPSAVHRATNIDGAAMQQGRVEFRDASRTSPSPEIAAALGHSISSAKDRMAAERRIQANPAAMHPQAEKGFSLQQRSQPQPETGPVKDGPNVTISIGRIEVRAAQPAAERPRRPAFRPRVSLDEFLGRHNGARS